MVGGVEGAAVRRPEHVATAGHGEAGEWWLPRPHLNLWLHRPLLLSDMASVSCLARGLVTWPSLTLTSPAWRSGEVRIIITLPPLN